MTETLATYPEAAGFKVAGPSKESARSTPARILQSRVLQYFHDNGADGLTADECAEGLSESILSVRPRLSELRRAGILIDSGLRRKNFSGKSATVWIRRPRV